MYDWANSDLIGNQYSAASIYYNSYQREPGRVWFLGTGWEDTVIYNYTSALLIWQSVCWAPI